MPTEDFHPNPRDSKYDIRDALCLIASYDGKGAGMTCGAFEDAMRGGMRWTLPPAGLAPDVATRVKIRVRGSRTIDAVVRNNYYDLRRPGKEQYAGIAPPRWIDAQGREVHPSISNPSGWLSSRSLAQRRSRSARLHR